jgi:hypothetical protein
VLQLWETAGNELDLRAKPAVAAKIKAVPSHRKAVIILTAPILDEESYPPGRSIASTSRPTDRSLSWVWPMV